MKRFVAIASLSVLLMAVPAFANNCSDKCEIICEKANVNLCDYDVCDYIDELIEKYNNQECTNDIIDNIKEEFKNKFGFDIPVEFEFPFLKPEIPTVTQITEASTETTTAVHTQQTTVKPVEPTTQVTTIKPVEPTTQVTTLNPITTTEAQTETTTAAVNKPVITTEAQTETTTAAENKPVITTEAQTETTTAAVNKPVITTEAQTETTTAAVNKPVITTEAQTETTTAAVNKPVITTEAQTETTTNVSYNSFAKQVLDIVNARRSENGLAPLKLNYELNNVAQLKAEDMRDNNYFSHTSPTYGSPFDMMNKFGISYKTAGENIAKGSKTPEAVVNGWMNSEGHRKNILNKAFTQMGLGYTKEGNYWAQMFIG